MPFFDPNLRAELIYVIKGRGDIFPKARNYIFLFIIASLSIPYGFISAALNVWEVRTDMQELMVPGERMVTVTPGRWTLYHEHHTSLNGKDIVVSPLDEEDLNIRFYDAQTNQVLYTIPPNANDQYYIFGRRGAGLLTMVIVSTASYRMVVSVSDAYGNYTPLEHKGKMLLTLSPEVENVKLDAMSRGMGHIVDTAFACSILGVLIHLIRRYRIEKIESVLRELARKKADAINFREMMDMGYDPEMDSPFIRDSGPYI
ncbi:MAG: hypothetical protein HY751_08195 [Nitrospinae bacterium]|nr:hypothetical protein [Nitrospinota bacterium]